jgi:predicted nucleic acid-binding protein
MVSGLLDTNIIVDLLRGHEIAKAWIAKQQDLALSRAVWLEALEGPQDYQTQRLTLNLLNEFELVEFTVSDFDWATRQLTRLHLSTNVDAFDCLIAAPSYRLQLPLYTRNMKHLSPLLGALAQEPYQVS